MKTYWSYDLRRAPDRDVVYLVVLRYTEIAPGNFKSEILTNHGWYEYREYDVLPNFDVPCFSGRDVQLHVDTTLDKMRDILAVNYPRRVEFNDVPSPARQGDKEQPSCPHHN